MKKVLAALAASGVLVAGGFATAAISTPTTAIAQESVDEAPTEGTDELVRPNRGAILTEVLDELVTDDVITADQAEQIAAALQAKHEELREQFGDRRRGRGFHGDFGLRGALEDGVIDLDELAELPEDHPIFDEDSPFAPYLEDGLTADELEELRGQLGPRDGSRGRGFGRFGPTAPSEEATNA